MGRIIPIDSIYKKEMPLSEGSDFMLHREIKPEWTGSVLRKRRRGAGITQAQVAEALGVSVRSVREWELVRIDMSTSNFLRYVMYLNDVMRGWDDYQYFELILSDFIYEELY